MVTQLWSDLPRFSKDRGYHGIASCGGHLYVTGGYCNVNSETLDLGNLKMLKQNKIPAFCTFLPRWWPHHYATSSAGFILDRKWATTFPRVDKTISDVLFNVPRLNSEFEVSGFCGTCGTGYFSPRIHPSVSGRANESRAKINPETLAPV